jgi:cellulose synthase/poly-beta-1,6-N-acetylglucosamine synthase-like glycosyltransferase
MLGRCLNALLRQDFDPGAYEIIIVDDAGCEETRSLIENFARKSMAYGYLPRKVSEVSVSPGPSRADSDEPLGSEGVLIGFNIGPEFRYIPATGTSGPAAARNLGWQAAYGEVIAFTDDDCIPKPDWLKQGLAAFEDGVAGVSGQVEVPLSKDPTDYQKNASQLAWSRFVTANCFYRRCALQQAGGFDQRFTTAWREDTDLFFRMLTRSFKLHYAPAAVVLHPVRPAPWGISIKQQRKSMYNALLYKNHPGLYRRHIQSRPPLKYYTIVLSAIIAWGAAASGSWTVASLMAILWALQTLHFALQRLRHTSRRLDHVLEMLVTSVFIPPLSVFWRLYGAANFKVFFL